MTHFLLLLQTVVEQLNANGVVYTPLKGKISEQGDDGSCPNARYEKKISCPKRLCPLLNQVNMLMTMMVRRETSMQTLLTVRI